MPSPFEIFRSPLDLFGFSFRFSFRFFSAVSSISCLSAILLGYPSRLLCRLREALVVAAAAADAVPRLLCDRLEGICRRLLGKLAGSGSFYRLSV